MGDALEARDTMFCSLLHISTGMRGIHEALFSMLRLAITPQPFGGPQDPGVGANGLGALPFSAWQSIYDGDRKASMAYAEQCQPIKKGGGGMGSRSTMVHPSCVDSWTKGYYNPKGSA